jgi:hypothetical protein
MMWHEKCSEGGYIAEICNLKGPNSICDEIHVDEPKESLNFNGLSQVLLNSLENNISNF